MIQTPIHPEIGELFTRLIANNRLASSYLFYGPPGAGKWSCALEIAGEVLSEGDPQIINRVQKLVHPDLSLIYPMPSPRKVADRDEFINHFLESKLNYPFLPVVYDRPANILKEIGFT